jgi:O-antigen ligase
MNFINKSLTAPSPLVEHLISLILLLYPTLIFLVRGGMNASLFLLVIISAWLLVAYRKSHWHEPDRTNILFVAAMASGVLVALMSQLYHHDMVGRYFDSGARFLLAVPVFLVFRNISLKSLSVVQYAFPMGAIAAFLAVMADNPQVKYSASTFFLNHIHLGDMALLLGVLSLLCINWIGRDNAFVKTLKILGFTAGLVVSILSSARGGWIAIPIFVGVYLYFQNKADFVRRFVMATVILVAIGIVGYLFVEQIHQRLWMIYSDLSQFGSGNIDTSIGVRLQLWKAALHLIAENPLLGVGAEGFARAMDVLSASGFITPVAAYLGKGEVHNEILAQTVRFGVFGLISILAIYFVPFYLFVRAAKVGGRQQVVASMMGMCVTLGFFVFGLTVETFDLKMTAAFYSLTVAVLLAIATHHSAPSN